MVDLAENHADVTPMRSRTSIHPDCNPHQHCCRCGKLILCGEDIIIPWRGGRRVFWHPGCGPTGWPRIYHCSTACYWRQLRARRREERTREVICESCGGKFQTLRHDARYCSSACRQDAYRQRKEHQVTLRRQQAQLVR
jgi:hypothetical protein